MAIAPTPTETPQSPRNANIPDDTGGLTGSMLGKYYCRLMIGKYERPTPFKKGNWKIDKRINLPLPDILQDNTSVKYNGVELESVGDFINGNVGSGLIGAGYRNVGLGLSTLGQNVLGSAAGAVAERYLKGTSELSNVIGGAVSEGVKSVFPADKVQSAFDQIVGAAPNPNPSVAFQGPNLREFQLTWTFFPTSESESDNIHNIVVALKRASLPRNSIAGSGALLDYPDMCQLNFFPWDDESQPSNGSNPWFWKDTSIIKIKKCVMNNVSVDYNVSNIPGFFAGTKNRPVAVRISIGFSEIEYMLANDWGETATDSGEAAFLLRVLGRNLENIINPVVNLFTLSSSSTDNTGEWTT